MVREEVNELKVKFCGEDMPGHGVGVEDETRMARFLFERV